MLTRLAIALVLILSTGIYTRGARDTEQPASRTSFDALSHSLGEYRGRQAPAFADDVVAQLGADDHVNRFYTPAAGPAIALYAGYYASQRQGAAIHSPQNCLPGAGWQPIFADRAWLPTPQGSFEVNRVVIEKGRDRQAVFYWYQGRGRITANEFANKGWLMLDAARLRRTDGGLVRLITPLTSGRDEAFARLAQFSAVLIPTLWSYLP
jgi:EpsI family protein